MYKKIILFLFLVIIQKPIFADTPIHGHHRHESANEQEIIGTEITLRGNEIFPFFYPLLKSMKKIGLPIEYLIQSLTLVRRVDFVEFEDQKIVAGYNKLTNTLQFGIDFINFETMEIKKLSQLRKIQISTIYHELWHAFYHQVIKAERPLFYYLYHNQLMKKYPGEIYGHIFHEESYGVYIDQVIENYLDFYAIFNTVGFEGRKKLRQSSKMRKRYFEMVNLPAHGYRWSILNREFIESPVNLSIEDRQLIYRYVFKGEVSYFFHENFEERLFTK